MRINKYLAECGLASRRASEQIITAGRVKLNGKIVTDLATDVSEDDFVTVDGKRAQPIQKIRTQAHFSDRAARLRHRRSFVADNRRRFVQSHFSSAKRYFQNVRRKNRKRGKRRRTQQIARRSNSRRRKDKALPNNGS